MHDETCKKLFAFPRMVEDLLRGFVLGLRPGEVTAAGPELARCRLAERLAPAGEAALRVGTVEELKMTLEERVAEWPKKWMQEGDQRGFERGFERGVERGVAQGVERGLMQQRAVLRRLAALRFGDEVAARVAQAVDRIAEPERLAAAGDWIVRADSGEELITRLAQLADPSQAGSA